MSIEACKGTGMTFSSTARSIIDVEIGEQKKSLDLTVTVPDDGGQISTSSKNLKILARLEKSRETFITVFLRYRPSKTTDTRPTAWLDGVRWTFANGLDRDPMHQTTAIEISSDSFWYTCLPLVDEAFAKIAESGSLKRYNPRLKSQIL